MQAEGETNRLVARLLRASRLGLVPRQGQNVKKTRRDYLRFCQPFAAGRME